MAKKKEQTNEGPELINYGLMEIPVSEIHPSDENPRSNMDEESVRELAESIKLYGVLQPVIIRPDEDFGTEASPWVMVCGHRRLMACKMIGLEKIPAIVRELSDDDAFDMMITENLQRKDIEPLDEAVAYRALIDHDGVTIADLCARFGKSEKYIRGRLALNDLVPELKECLKAGSLTIGAAISLSALSMEQQLEFYKDYGPVTSELDGATVIVPMSIGDVKLFIEDTSDLISQQAFYEDPEEKWNTGNLHKCAGCPFNSESQGALFADMIDAGNCSNEACLKEKTLAYARHIFNYWLPNFKPANGFLEPGDVVLYVQKDPWFRAAAKDEMQNLYDLLSHQVDELGSFNSSKSGGRVWRTDAESRKDAIRVLNLRDLIAGDRDYMSYWHLPKQSKDPSAPQEVTPDVISRRLNSVYDERQAEICELLEPTSKAAIEAYFNADTVHQEMPEFVQKFIAFHLVDRMSWNAAGELLGTHERSLKNVSEYVEHYGFVSVLKAVLLDRIENAPSYCRGGLMQLVMEGVADSSCAEIIQGVYSKYQPKVDKLTRQLRDMGYDESGRPLQVENESNENKEAES